MRWRFPFLTARWSNLALLTYRLPPSLLQPFVPPDCELDLLNGDAFASLVAFDFLQTRVLGARWPGFVNFPEVNLRIYVRHRNHLGVHRGVAFVREFVPSRFIAMTARRFYNEPYLAAPMKSSTRLTSDTITIDHCLATAGRKNTLHVIASRQTSSPPPDSTEFFFKEHEWGFGASRSGRLIRYQVVHPVWEIYPVRSFQLDWDFAAVYGSHWAVLQSMEPMSVILAAGSNVAVFPRGIVQGSRNQAGNIHEHHPATTRQA